MSQAFDSLSRAFGAQAVVCKCLSSRGDFAEISIDKLVEAYQALITCKVNIVEIETMVEAAIRARKGELQ